MKLNKQINKYVLYWFNDAELSQWMKGQMDLGHFVEVLKPVLFRVSAANMRPMVAIIKH